MSKKPVEKKLTTSKTPVDQPSKSDHQRLLPKDTSVLKKTYWSFGFKFFQQLDKFGFSTVDTGWFVSILERWRDTSKMEYTGTTEVLEAGYRYHIINWNSKNCPLKRNDFNWVNSEYLNNELEYPFCQFHISKAKGRIIGFWDESNVFQILLLDPLHNLQPSKKVAYEIRDCFPAQSHFESLRFDIDQILNNSCPVAECLTFKKLRELPTGTNNSNIVAAHLDDSFFVEYNKILESNTFSKILEAGIIALSS